VRLVREEAASAATPADLQQALRTHHPRAVVHQRELEGERAVVWYVYREGRWIPI